LSGKQRTISSISYQPNFMKFEHNTSIGVAMKRSEKGKILPQGIVFSKKRKNLSKF